MATKARGPAPGRRDASGMKWGEGTIKERPRADGSIGYQARWTDAGHAKERTRTFGTRDEAEDCLREQHRAKRDGRYAAPSTRTIAELAEAWWTRGTGRWRESTAYSYSQTIRLHITPHIGAWRVSDLTAARMQRWIDGQVAAGVSTPVLTIVIQVLRMVLTESTTLGIIPANPMTGVRGPTYRPKRAATWTLAEVGVVFAAVADDPMWSAVYRLALTTGIRPGELRALRWGDVDVDQGLIRIERTATVNLSGNAEIGEKTKSGKHRSVAVPDSTMRALIAYRATLKVRRINGDRDYVFASSSGRFLQARTWHDAHTDLIARAGVTRITLHQMRHTAATLMLEQNIHPKIVSDILGHSKVAMTLDRYSHVNVDLQRAAADALDARLSSRENDAARATT